MAFHDVRFPTDIAYTSAGGPNFETQVVGLSSGHERRASKWDYPLERWDVAYGVTTQPLMKTLLYFFYQRRGRMHSFRFKNHDDYTLAGSQIGSGNGSQTDFPVYKVYPETGGTYAFSRRIWKPLSSGFRVFKAGIEQFSGWSLDTTNGIVEFSSPPTGGQVITVHGEFDLPVRFDTDYLPLQLVTYEAGEAAVPIVEIRMEEP